ncbi:MAG: hypothetical protein PHN72_00850 [Bacilli bacterium]|nr:hypothetical protein [Bacilli bacterium]
MEKEKKGKLKKVLNSRTMMIVVAVILILLVCYFAFFRKRSNEKQLTDSLNEMGKTFYENFYYEQIGSSAEEKKNLLSKFTTVGIKVDLDNLGRYNNGEFAKDIEKFKNELTSEKCNKTNTKVVIYPQSPYGKTDYKTEAKLDCGFKK